MQENRRERISSHPLLTPERQAELDALADKFQTKEAREEAQRDIERVLEGITTQNRITKLEQEMKELKEKLNTLIEK